jgi:transketolase
VRYTAAPRHASNVEEVAPGRASVLHRGSDVTLLAFGALLGAAEQARQLLEASGLSVGLLNLRWLAPLDERAVLHAASECPYLVTIEDHFLVGGLYSTVAMLLQRAGVATRLIPIGLAEQWFAPGRLEDVIEHAGLSGAALALRIERAMAAKRS